MLSLQEAILPAFATVLTSAATVFLAGESCSSSYKLLSFELSSLELSSLELLPSLESELLALATAELFATEGAASSPLLPIKPDEKLELLLMSLLSSKGEGCAHFSVELLGFAVAKLAFDGAVSAGKPRARTYKSTKSSAPQSMLKVGAF